MGKSHEQRKREIVEAAMELTVKQGIKRVTTQAIADRVGIAQPTVFRHFKNRDAIFAAVIAWVAEHLFKAIGAAVRPDDPPEEQLRLLIRHQLGFINQHRAIPKVLFSDLLHLESPQLKAALQQVMDRYMKRVTELLSAGIESGCFRKDLDAQETARYVTALVQGLVLRWSIYEFSFSLEEEAGLMWEFLWPALQAR